MAAPGAFWSSLLWQTVLFLAVAYGVITAVLFLLQSRLVYYPNLPSRTVAATPENIGLAFESVQFTTADGVRLDGWFVPAEAPRGVLLFCHGNAGNISHRLDSLRMFHELGLSTFIFDYRGYGRSEGKPSEQGTYRDAAAAWRYLTETRGVAPERIVLFGRSLGSSIAAHLAMGHAPGALILESAFTSAPDVGARTYPFLPVRWLSRFQYDTRAYLQGVTAPLLIIHSRNDEIIPFKFGQALFASANQPKQFLEISGNHNEGFMASGSDYVDGIDKFLSNHLDR